MTHKSSHIYIVRRWSVLSSVKFVITAKQKQDLIPMDESVSITRTLDADILNIERVSQCMFFISYQL